MEEQKQELEQHLRTDTAPADGEDCTLSFPLYYLAQAALDDADERSIFVKNVDYSADPAELKEHFGECGEVKRITIPVDKFSNQPKGYLSLLIIQPLVLPILSSKPRRVQ